MVYENEKLLIICTRGDLRNWLQENCNIEKSCWIMVSIKPTTGTLLYLDAVEEALCYGWIDGIKKKISDKILAQRLSPRSKNSSWTELNKERVRRLEKLGLMTDEGRKVLPEMNYDSFQIDKSIEQRLKEEEIVYEKFCSFPELYKRIRIDSIQSYKNNQELFDNKLDKFIKNTKYNKMYGQWNDNGRLIDY
ncbi:bacteriocin resistance YdeI/OmpD-like protein [Mobilisporobacter senegalensis]|uniref:Bacteriocin resistance YdeI/OmpD-like protein n=1 Tax=Mobilisporobacter senegalensis TaxID=1329262 RepID=A0A3N1XHW1_9FIRM|nr:YdeI/OmpD-associated family protein [Mobilisporobacter senegalensis]ROR26330.1 bacteriocin resistance YdeI/OmpD-like protein [Mobilisporobacter senegalensis]